MFRNATSDPPTKPPPRKNYYVNKDEKFKIFKSLYKDKNITLDVYLKNIIGLFKFKKNKKETVGDLTSDSDADSDVSYETYDVSQRSNIDEASTSEQSIKDDILYEYENENIITFLNL